MVKQYQIVNLLLSTALFAMAGCAIKPDTRYYDLALQPTTQTTVKLNRTINLGVGPISLPDALDRSGIVTRTSQVNVKVSNYHVWASPLEQAFTRVLWESLAHNLSQDSVWAFPWDTRFRPEYQVRVFISQFSGEAGGTVILKLQWTLLESHGQKVMANYRYQSETITQDKSYNSYVSALNQLLNEFANDMSKKIAAKLVSVERQ